MHAQTTSQQPHTTGLFDDVTLAAVKQFQERKRMKAMGSSVTKVGCPAGEPVIPHAGDDGSRAGNPRRAGHRAAVHQPGWLHG